MTTSCNTTYSMVTNPVPGTTGTGLDQLVEYIYADPSLAGNNSALDILGGAAAANQLNQLILQAAAATGAAADKIFTVAEVTAMNAWIRQNKLTEWTALHGDDEDGEETGFHLVQNDNSNLQYRGENLINTVADGVYHMGFEIQNGHFLNEDGNPNASVEQVASWLTQFYTDHSTTGTGFDRIPNLIMADAGLPCKTSEADIGGGADAANGMNKIIVQAIQTTNALADGAINATDVQAMNAWIRADAGRLAQWTLLHGDDAKTSETGFHLVQNDGGNTKYFGKNLVNTVADGIYHMGFQIQNGSFVNEDGNANATVTDVADWLNYFYTDQSTTGTGLDRIVDAIKADVGLSRNTSAADINAGAGYANQFNQFIVQAINATGVMADGWIDAEDVRAMNAWIRADSARLNSWTLLHGDDEDGQETGYHLVQNDGGNTTYFGKNLINTVVDGIYHLGFEIQGSTLLNEDGDANASISNVASWLNYFYKSTPLIQGTDGGETLQGTAVAEELSGKSGDDTLLADGGDDLVNGGNGNDSMNGGAGADVMVGGLGDDSQDGGDGSDLYRVSGNQAGGWSSFNGYDTYGDTGATGTDKIQAVGVGDVDIGLTGFGPQSGIETIDASGATGVVRLLGNSKDNTLDFRGVTLTGPIIIIDGNSGADTIFGNVNPNVLVGGVGDDILDGSGSGDIYRVTGNQAGGWSSFNGYDTYNDTGVAGADKIVALGTGDVDIGLTGFGPQSGIESIDATGATGLVRLLGNSKDNTLDFRGATLTGANLVIDGNSGADTLYGNAIANVLVGGSGDDVLDGSGGGDTYRVTGNQAGGWSSFNGYDTYSDTGASGTDTIAALGTGDVDIGLTGFGPQSGIEIINTTGATGLVRLLGDSKGNMLDFRGLGFIGNSPVFDGGNGDDIVLATSKADSVRGGEGNDTLLGYGGADLLDGGNSRDLLLDSQGGAGGNDIMVGGTGKDRLVVAHNDHSTVDVYGGTQSGGDGTTDCLTLLGVKGALDLSVIFHDFESGKDRIDLTQLRDVGNNRLDLNDLVITTANGATDIGFAAGVHTVAGGSVACHIQLLGIASVGAADFAFTDSQIPSGLSAIDPALAYFAG